MNNILQKIINILKNKHLYRLVFDFTQQTHSPDFTGTGCSLLTIKPACCKAGIYRHNTTNIVSKFVCKMVLQESMVHVPQKKGEFCTI